MLIINYYQYTRPKEKIGLFKTHAQWAAKD